MNKLVTKLAWTTCLAGGALLLTGGPAGAAAAPIGGTTNAAAPADHVVTAHAQAPITGCAIAPDAVCGVSVALVGDATGTCTPAPACSAPAPAAKGAPRDDVINVKAHSRSHVGSLPVTGPATGVLMPLGTGLLALGGGLLSVGYRERLRQILGQGVSCARR